MLYQNNQFLCGDYVRLSREDGDKLESDSIHNQKELISDYHRKHPGLTFVKEYVDDGYSGTNFERPGFQQMMKDAENGIINCIIVKDLSRLGRNYIEMGRYTERIFPTMGIRFIAINDHYDSAEDTNESDSMIIPFKNLINDSYCRDISTKIRSHLDVKRKNGKFIGSFASYGYFKDPEDKNRLIVDEYAAEVIRTIYGWKLDGMSSQRIASRLDNIGVLPPLEYKRSCGMNFNNGFRAGKDPKWSVKSVNRILRNELYTGVMVQGKHKKISYKIKKSLDVEEKDWIKVEGTHDAIISKEIFEQVQNMLAIDTRIPPEKETVYLFSGFLRCGDCGQNMVRRLIPQRGKEYFYYHCSTYKDGGECSPHRISEKQLEKVVILAIQKQVALLVNAQKTVNSLKKGMSENYSVKTVEKQIAKLQTEVSRYQGMKDHLYQDLYDDVITSEEYKELNSRFARQMKKSQGEISQLEEKKKTLLEREDKAQPWLEEFCSYGNITSLDRKVLAATVDHITVYSKDRIEICFRYEDEMAELLEQAGICRDRVPEYEEAGV